MWVVQIDDQIAGNVWVAPMAASGPDTLRPVMLEYLRLWAMAHEQDLDQLFVHLENGDSRHPPRIVVGEVDPGDKALEFMVEFTAYEVNHYVLGSETFTGQLAVAERMSSPVFPASATLH